MGQNPGTERRSVRLLFAEDDRQLRNSVSRGLREAAYEVEQAANGVQALELASAGGFDAIILDVLLPRKDGIAVCRAIREQGNHVPILMLTALDAVEDRITGLDAGADDYLVKPFDFGELLARLRALTRRHGESGPAQLRIADLTVDVQAHRVWRGDREITLTAREFAFLLHLARHAGRAVSRADLMAHVWEDSGSAYSNIIDVYASRLRRKIDEGEKITLFRTLRGTGYMLETPGRSAPRSGARRRD
jgi:two-component system copper resistance phosphate regulon response regulator CusR